MVRKTHEAFVEEAKAINPNIEILGRYIGRHKRITVRCIKHDYIYDPFARDVLRGHGCIYCRSDKMHDYFAMTPDEFEKEMYDINPNIKIIGKYINSNTNVLCSCQLCNTDFYINPGYSRTSQTISCPVCSDGISYPNKFMRYFLKQLPVQQLQFEWKPEWNKKYSYDNYFIFNGIEYVVEADGAQHYQKNKFGKWKPDEVQARDRIKDELVKEHNINMIRIDCQKSDPDYIQNKITNSPLSSIFDLSHIDWNYCHSKATDSFVKQVCDLYNDGYKIIDIARKLSLDRATVRKYLKLGNKLCWCDYDSNESTNRPKSVNVYNEQNELIHTYNSVRQTSKCMEQLYGCKFPHTPIKMHCINGIPFKGFIFKYA